MDVLKKIKQIEAVLLTRKSKNRLFAYNAGKVKHKKQLAFHKSQKKNRWVFGGNRTGKTECGAVEAIFFARGNHQIGRAHV